MGDDGKGTTLPRIQLGTSIDDAPIPQRLERLLSPPIAYALEEIVHAIQKAVAARTALAAFALRRPDGLIYVFEPEPSDGVVPSEGLHRITRIFDRTAAPVMSGRLTFRPVGSSVPLRLRVSVEGECARSAVSTVGRCQT